MLPKDRLGSAASVSDCVRNVRCTPVERLGARGNCCLVLEPAGNAVVHRHLITTLVARHKLPAVNAHGHWLFGTPWQSSKEGLKGASLATDSNKSLAQRLCQGVMVVTAARCSAG